VHALIAAARGYLGHIDIYCSNADIAAGWPAATYGHRGLTVHCICPQGVKTRMLAEPAYYRLRAEDTGKWLRGMNRMQQRIEEAEQGMR
jgi:hypothetical protein